MSYLEPDYPNDESKKKELTMCDLCATRRATHYIWEAEVGILIDVDSCHIYMCGECVVQVLRIQRRRETCPRCKNPWARATYSVRLANGKDSSLLCKDCHLGGGHGQEIRDAIKNRSARDKLTRSV